MSALTRNLLPYAVGRAAMETVSLVTVTPEPSEDNDGSYSAPPVVVPAKARVVMLTPNEMVRLAEGGITLNRGVSVALTGELEKAPDQVVRADGTLLKVVKFTIEEGASIFLCDVPALGADGQAYGSGYS